MELSCCLIVKDEEKTLGRVLECAKKIADEIVVVDTGSTDKSMEIAKSYTDKIYYFEWCDDFSKARNFAFSKASKEYLMWLDADDFIDDDNIAKIIQYKAKNKHYDVVFMRYATVFDKNGKPTFCFKRERIVKNLPQFRFVDPIHEVIIPSGKIIDLDITIEHRKEKESDPLRNLKIYENLMRKGIPFSSRMQFYYANELFYTNDFEKAINIYEDYLLKPAYVENQIQACLNLAKCYYKLEETAKAKQTLFRSFNFDIPRAELLCELSLYLINENLFNQAIYWLKKAIGKPNYKKGGFILPDCYDFVPYYNLAFCEYKMNHIKSAIKYAKKAFSIKPADDSVKHNLNFYKSLLREK